jgi:hypothetical protein
MRRGDAARAQRPVSVSVECSVPSPVVARVYRDAPVRGGYRTRGLSCSENFKFSSVPFGCRCSVFRVHVSVPFLPYTGVSGDEVRLSFPFDAERVVA